MALKKMKLADLFWNAANTHLSPVYHPEPPGMDAFSCNAVGLAYAKCAGQRGYLHPSRDVRDFLSELGCTGSAVQLACISEHENGSQWLQGVRYMWLLLAMHVAEDEGIEVEVER